MLPADHPLLPGNTTAPPEAMRTRWAAKLGHHAGELGAGHPGPLELWGHLGLGARADGLLVVPDPEWLEPTLDAWLGGPAANRTPLAYTGLGDILYFRDLSQRARDLGLDEATIATACDVSLLCTRYKQVQVLAHSMAQFIEQLEEPAFLEDAFARSLYAAGVEHAGVPGSGQILGFVPALGLGGSEDPSTLQVQSAPEHWSILLQL